MSRRLLCAALVTFVSAAPWARARQSGPPPPAPPQQQSATVFKGRVDLVTLDVTVSDKDGHPVKGLAPDDFIVTLEGQRRPVRVMDYLAFDGPAASGATTPAAGESTNRAPATAAINRGGRVVMLMFDDLSFKPLEGKGFTVAAERVLGQFGFDDLVGLVTSSGLGPAINPTRDRTAIASAFHDKRLFMGRSDDDPPDFYIGVNEVMGGVPSDFVGRECGKPQDPARGGAVVPDEVCASRVLAAARILARATWNRTAAQLAAYRAAIQALRAAPAPRVLVLLSAGVAWTGDTTLLDAIGREAAEAGVQFFALVDASDPLDLGSRGLCPTVECQYLRAQVRRNERRFMVDGMDDVAAATGGELLRTIGTADRMYTRILAETSGLYHLGVDAPSTVGAGRFLKLKVTVRRPGATVLANRNALLPSATTTPVSIDDALKLRLAQGGVAFGVPIALSTARRRDPGTPDQVQVAMNVELPGTTPGPVVAMFSLLSAAGLVVKSGRQTLPAPADGGDYRMAFALPVGEGTYQLRFAAADASGSIGSVEHGVAGTLSRFGAFAVSDLFTNWIGDDDKPQFLALERMPAAAKTLQTSVELYPDNPTTAPEPIVRFTVKKAGEADLAFETELTPIRNAGTFTATAEIPVAALEPAAYTVEATVLIDGRSIGSVFQFVRKTERMPALSVSSGRPATVR